MLLESIVNEQTRVLQLLKQASDAELAAIKREELEREFNLLDLQAGNLIERGKGGSDGPG